MPDTTPLPHSPTEENTTSTSVGEVLKGKSRGVVKPKSKKKRATNNPQGAPTLYGPYIIGKLEEAFAYAYNISEACQHAGIHRDTYYEWLNSKEGFSDRMDIARSSVTRTAKKVVMMAVKSGDANMAFKLLQAKDPEFKNKLEVAPGAGLTESRKKIKDFLDERDSDYGPTIESNVASTEHSSENAAGSGEAVEESPPAIS